MSDRLPRSKFTLSRAEGLAMTGAGIFLFFAFILFSYLVHKDLFTSLDFNTTVRLQGNLPRRLDGIFSLFSDIGKFEVATIFLVLVFVFTRKMIAGVAAMSLYIGFHLIELFGKFFVNHPPPPEFMLRTERIINFPQFHVRSEFSYPSGHSGRTIFISVILVVLILRSSRLSRLLKMILIGGIVGFDLIMLVSRVYLGEHWTTDVIGGAILGGALGLVTGEIIHWKKAKK